MEEPGMFLWLIYAECRTCGAGAKQACAAGQKFGPHEGRPTRWEKDADAWLDLTYRVSAQMKESAQGAAQDGYVPPTEEHGERAWVRWAVHEGAGELVGWQGGCLCHCGELFVRTVAQGGMDAARRAMAEHVERPDRREFPPLGEP